MNEDFYDKARELANMILLSIEGQNLNNAKKAFLGSDRAIQSLEEYNNYHNTIKTKLQNDELSEEEINEASEKLSLMYKELKKDSTVGPLIFAETQFNDLVTNVMNIFKATLTGEEIKNSDCAGECSGCSGCH